MTDKILIDRKELEQVLGALENRNGHWGSSARELKERAITTLQTRLAEPAPQIVDCHSTGVCVQSGLRAEQPAQKRPQNCGTAYCSCIECVMEPAPVAWLVEFENGEQELHFEEQPVGEINTPLYTRPPAQQEPVAFEPNDAELFKAFTRSNNGPNPFYRCNTCGDIEPGLREYLLAHWLMHNNTSPPAQRTWVGLTDEDRAQCVQATVESGEALQLMSCIEAKLREKNT